MDVRKSDLVDGIGKVLPAIARKEFFDQADKLAFTDGKLVAYNDEISIHHPLPPVKGLEGVVDGKKLHQLLNRLPATADTVKLTETDNALRVEAGRARLELLMVPVALPFSEIDWSGDPQPLPDGFKTALRLVAGCCARDMSRPVLTCVSISGNSVTGSDSYRMAQFKFKSADFPAILLPVSVAELLLGDDYNINRIAVGDGGEWVRFKTLEDTDICARLSAGTYPDLSSIFEVEGAEISLPSKLKDAIDRAQIFAKRDHLIDEEVQITLGPLDNRQQIVVNASYDGGRFEERVRGDVEGNGEKFAIHPEFLIKALTDEGHVSCILDKSKIKFVGQTWEHVVALR